MHLTKCHSCLTLFFFVFVAIASAETALKHGPYRDVTITQKNTEVSEITISGPTPHFWSQPVTVPKQNTILTFDYFSPTGVGAISVRFRNPKGEMVFAGSKPLPLVETWQPFSIELLESPKFETRLHISLKGKLGTGFQMRNFRLRQPNPTELIAQNRKEEIARLRNTEAEQFLNYFRDTYPGQIDEVEVGKSTIRISGKSSSPVHLVELPPHIPSNSPPPGLAIQLANVERFEIEIPRFAGKSRRDRSASRWRLDTPAGKTSSLAKWPTQYTHEVGDQALEKLTAKSQKGIGGLPLISSPDHQVFELGVKHATVNCIVDGLLYRTKKPGLKPWYFEGRTYYLNEKFLAGKDRTIRNLCKNNVIVTCILLVGNGPGAEMKHPEAESRGVYSIPNLTTEGGAHHYRAAIHFLSKRFSQPDARISNWVIHNEIDQAGTWTNMGAQPLARYLDTYSRSARIVYHTSRLHDPHTRVFISLTHHWVKQSGGLGTYQVKGLLDLWSEISEAEGAFHWGVAYHPYPRDLRNPDTWNDKEVSFDFETPYITPKNIEFLPAYLCQDRPILLSEQGFNSPTLSETDQQRQAAGLIYMFRKLRSLPSIEAYHLHRYQDMPDREGGLRLGILDEKGNRKIGWHTYVAIGTDKILPIPIPVKKIQSRK
ncbi:MAG: hypothetical protein ACJAR1_000173 [Rubritalea sp.]|jgi:hypothetical protein